MKVLIDENLPHRLRPLLVGHDVFTVAWLGWTSTRNGALLAKAAAHGFDVLVTGDTGLEYQQNLATLPVAVIVIHAKNNEIGTIAKCVSDLQAALAGLVPRSVVHLTVAD